MTQQTNPTWPLLAEPQWAETNNLLDTLLYRELTLAEQRRFSGNESLIQSAHIIHTNMLIHIYAFKPFKTENTQPELALSDNICQILNLPTGSISIHQKISTSDKDSV